ncbi:MAG: hypothetical protein ABSE51_01910 [Terracidiphilus sp.]
MEAMILHAASIAALFVDQLTQAPVVVQCVLPPNADPWWKQWIQPISSLVSIVAVVSIAIWSFGATSRKEHRRWILDQKKAEWQELLRAAAHMRRVVSLGLESPQTRAKLIQEGLKPAVQELEVSAANCVFLSDFFGNEVKSKRFYSFLRDTDLKVESINASFSRTQHLQDPHPDLTDQQRERGKAQAIIEIGDLADTIAQEFIGFNDWLRKEAAISLGTLAPEKRSAHTEDGETP